ncbi:MAG: DUF3168 domain-containing protein [Sphingomonas sp.]|nr:DUF3168 domain-containing protein [Sphingomonas sp.]
MSAEAAFQAALVATLRAAVGDRLNGVFEGPAVKATPPYAEIGELLSIDWSTKDAEGRELRSLIQMRDRAETAVGLQALACDADAAIRAMAPALDGWRIASLALVRNRIVRANVGQWVALIEHRARVLAD